MTIVGLLATAVVLVALFVYLVRKQAPKAPSLGLSPAIPRRYTRHARDRMLERDVSRNQIEAALTSPDRRRSDPTEGSIQFEKDFEHAVLKVWVAAQPWPPTTEVVVKSTAWKHFATFVVPADSVARIKGRQGATVREIENSTGARISLSREGTVTIRAGERFNVEQAKKKIDEIVNRPSIKVGQRMVATVMEIVDHGARVRLPNNFEGFVPVVNLRPIVGGKRINDIHTVISVNQRLEVEVQSVRNGRPRLKAIASTGV